MFIPHISPFFMLPSRFYEVFYDIALFSHPTVFIFILFSFCKSATIYSTVDFILKINERKAKKDREIII